LLDDFIFTAVVRTAKVILYLLMTAMSYQIVLHKQKQTLPAGATCGYKTDSLTETSRTIHKYSRYYRVTVVSTRLLSWTTRPWRHKTEGFGPCVM